MKLSRTPPKTATVTTTVVVFVLGWDERDGRRADNEFYKLTATLDERGIAYAAEW